MNQKDRERYYLDHFLEVLENPPTGQIKHAEQPDFLIENKSDCIGIEVTEAYYEASDNGSPIREQESLERRALKEVESRLTEKGIPSFQINVSFRPHYDAKRLTRKRENHFINELTQLIETEIAPLSDQRVSIDFRKLPKELTALYLGSTSTIGQNFVAENMSGGSPSYSSERLQEIINSKNKKVQSYREKCKEIWLLIVADNYNLSSWANSLSQGVQKHQYNSQFDRVFFFRRNTEDVQEIKVKK